jgi:hypothetical protein
MAQNVVNEENLALNFVHTLRFQLCFIVHIVSISLIFEGIRKLALTPMVHDRLVFAIFTGSQPTFDALNQLIARLVI